MYNSNRYRFEAHSPGHTYGESSGKEIYEVKKEVNQSEMKETKPAVTAA